ncbi:MAG: helix-turn-helix domain-containing protein [Firmicutes bacterium]|nr:helix-turn-helix domain-containing protein [Bacillota bacterium]
MDENKMVNIERKNFYSALEIAKILNLTKVSVYRLINSGRLAGYKFGGVYRVTYEDLMKFITESKLNFSTTSRDF